MRERSNRLMRPLSRMAFAGAVSLMVTTGVVSAGSVSAQSGSEPSVEAQLRDFVFFVNINRDDAAQLKIEEILGLGLTPIEMLTIVEAERMTDELQQALGRALRRGELEPAAARLFKLLETARLQRARDPGEIAENIEALNGTLRAKLFARDRLKAAGEYAMPQLLEALLQRRDQALRTEVQRLLSEAGRAPVVPLSTALLEIDPTSQEAVATILGRLGYKAAAPYLAELRNRTESDAVRRAASASLEALGVSGEAASLHRELAQAYYDERDELTAFPGETVQLLWDYDPAIGLIPTAIDTVVFHEAMAMRHAENAMELGAARGDALSLWVASNFSREIDEPAGYDNPAYPPTMREAMYYAVASGPSIGDAVLGRALSDRDTPLARRAVEAIERTAGPNQLWDRSGGAGPLAAALGYPSRRVQYDAALALAVSMPAREFSGSNRVIPTLTSALRFSGQKFAMVLSETQEQYGSVRRVLEGRGYTVLPYGNAVADLAEPLVAVPGVDLIVVQAAPNATTELVNSVRNEAALAAAPLLALAPTPELPRLRRAYDTDASVAVRSLGIGDSGLSSTLDALVDQAAGGEISESEALAYAERSVRAMRDLAIASNQVLSVADATTSLVSALNESEGPIRLEIAEVLSLIDRSEAQQTLAQAVFDAAGSERVALLDTLAASARRHGNMLDQPLIDRLVELAETGADDEATGAAAVIGALGLSQRDLVKLILATG